MCLATACGLFGRGLCGLRGLRLADVVPNVASDLLTPGVVACSLRGSCDLRNLRLAGAKVL